jgi:methylmalonyl-CoA/ethylmalonyl-CoA epimerase
VEIPNLKSSGLTRMVDAPIAHISYVVRSIPDAVAMWAEVFGAGPFFLLEGIEFSRVEYCGSPAAWEHSAAHGMWGPIGIELQENHRVAPEGLASLINRPEGAINHIAFVTSDPESASARLERNGMPQVLYAQNDSVEMRWHSAPSLGHAIEIHRDSNFVSDFAIGLRAASDGWDGSEPLRRGAPF